MKGINRAARAAIIVAGAFAVAGAASVAQAQHTPPRTATGTLAPRSGTPDHGYPGRVDQRERPGPGWDGRYQRNRNPGGTTVIYLPADGDNGYYPQQPGIVYPQGGVYSAPGVYSSQVVLGQAVYGPSGNGMGLLVDASGRPVAPSYGVVGGAGYTPDLSGTPYVVVADGMMLADMPNGEQRSFASCAVQSAQRDPGGKPRTIFYSPSAYGLVLREGQQGRVQGTPPAATKACYGIDQFGRVALLY
jgi:hypothetical protein